MPPFLTYTPREMPDPAADQLRAHLAKLLDPSTYRRLVPADPDVQHPAVEQDRYLRQYLETRNRLDRTNRAAMAVAGYATQGFARPEYEQFDEIDEIDEEVA